MAKKQTSTPQKEKLFEERLVPAKTGSKLFEVSYDTDKPVECLGIKFANDEARRAHFLEKLREKLQDPAFRKIEGFPIGTDEDILALSDPPYYTACPNPWISTFITQWSAGKAVAQTYHREPLAVDVNVGKSDPIYQAHSYHTKVPHLAIVPSILHYTTPGDVILDAFCGSGMTGVATHWCDVAPQSYRHELEAQWKKDGRNPPKWGKRNVILLDLAPAATFIASNYNLPVNIDRFEAVSSHLLDELRNTCAWVYETHNSRTAPGTISFTVWSDVFACADCSHEFPFLDSAIDKRSGRVLDEFPCPHCGSKLNKGKLSLVFTTVSDPVTREPREQPKRVPRRIKYKVGKKSDFKELDTADRQVLERVAGLPFPTDAPTAAFPDMQMTRVGRMRTTKVEYVRDLFFPRSLYVLSSYFRMCRQIDDVELRNALLMLAQHQFVNASLLNRYRPASTFGNSPLTGVFYVSSLIAEANVTDLLSGSVKRITRMAKTPWGSWTRGQVAIGTSSATDLSAIPESSIDYVFTDPPFGENIYYSDLNFLPESWHRVFSCTRNEAIVDRVKEKSLSDYQDLMRKCFSEFCRVLKAGRWMTVVFHNSKNAVWNAIQEALQSAGFVVADVRTLDKQHGSFQQIVSGNTVKRDLIISAYKPNGGLEERFRLEAGKEDGVWDFVTTHLRQLPVFVAKGTKAEPVAERQPHLLFDRMVAFHVQRGVSVPLSTAEFHAGLQQRYALREGMFFLPEQAVEYDKKRLAVDELIQLELFVSNEASAVQWVRQQLSQRPQTYQELTPQFMREIAAWEKHEKMLEFLDLLKENFLCYDGDGDVPSQIHSYLSTNFHELRSLKKDDAKLVAKAKNRWYVPDPRKEADLEKIRHRGLMKEFNEYRESKGKLKIVRTEALRAGFKDCWQKGDYHTIVAMASRVKDEIVQEDPALLMYYDNALMRTGN